MTSHIEVETLSARTALVVLHGEQDLGTRPAVVAALQRAGACPHVVVDLSPCTFLDSSVLSAVSHAARLASSAGGELEIVAPPTALGVRRTLELMGFDLFLTISASRDDALAAGVPR